MRQLILFLLLGTTAHAQRFNIRTFDIKDGLPLGQPLNLFESSEGFLFLATYAGLTRYDGTQWITWTRHNGIPSSEILDIEQLSDGSIIASFENQGLWTVLPQARPILPELSQTTIHTMLMDSNGVLWIATTGGLFRWNNQVLVCVYPNPNIALTRVRDTIWIADHSKVYSFDSSGNQLRTIEHPKLLSGIKYLTSFAGKELMVGADGGVLIFQPEPQWIPYPEGVSVGDASCDDDPNLTWLGCSSGLIAWTGVNWCRLTKEHGLPDSRVRSIEYDKIGNLWVGTDGGLARYQYGPFASYSVEHGLPHPFVRCLFRDRDGIIWAGTRRGPARFIKRRFEALPLELFPDPLIYDIDQDRSGRMLFATRHGFTVLDKGQSTHYTQANGLPTDIMVSLLVDASGRIWLGGRGLFEWRNGQFVEYGRDNLASASVVTMAEQNDGTIWLGTSRGPQLFDPRSGHFEDYGAQIATSIWSIETDDHGTTWFATNGYGVAQYHPDKGMSFIDQTNGLPNDYAWQVLKQGQDLWIGHGKGISQKSADQWKHYDISDGLADAEQAATACLALPNGDIWFGSGSGISTYTPSLKSPTITELPTYLTSVDGLIDGESTWGQPPISFRFNAIHLNGPTLYQYRLIGLGEQWSPATRERGVTFANLNPGTYQFEVRSVLDNGFMGQPLVFPFIIHPQWWQTTLSRLMGILCLGLVVLLIVKLRTRRMEQRRQELETQVAAKTRALRRANQELLHVQEQLVETAHQAGVAESARQFLHLAGNTLNSMAVSIHAIKDYVRDSSEYAILDRLKNLTTELQPNQLTERLPPVLDSFASLKKKRSSATQSELNSLTEGLRLLTQVVRDQEDLAANASMTQPFDFAGRLKDMLDQPPEWLREGRFAVDLKVCDNFPTIAIPRVVIMRVVRELLRNAVDAIDAQGGRNHHISIDLSCDSSTITVSIKDTGIGLLPEEINRAFTYGFSTKEGASGFGLHYCANTLRELNGNLSLHSDGPGQGATATLTIPLKHESKVTIDDGISAMPSS